MMNASGKRKIFTTVSAHEEFPLRTGEQIRVKNPDGSLWRTYRVGPKKDELPGKIVVRYAVAEVHHNGAL
jgi:hypothetical protein